MRVARIAAEAITSKYGTKYDYGSAAALLCKESQCYILNFSNGHVLLFYYPFRCCFLNAGLTEPKSLIDGCNESYTLCALVIKIRNGKETF